MTARHGATFGRNTTTGCLEDVFELQEELTHSIVAAIAPEIDVAEEQRVAHQVLGNVTAYDLALRASMDGREGYEKSDRTLLDRAIGEGEQAVALEL